MTAYGAVISLKNTIDYVLRSSHFTLVEPSRKLIQPAYNELQPLQQILEELDKTSPSRSRKKVNALDGRIKDLVWEFEDSLESHVLSQRILSQFVDLQLLQDEVGPFIHSLKEMKKDYIHELGNMPEDDEASSSVIGFRGTHSKMIGSSYLFQQVKQKLIVRYARMNVLGLVGMAGVGKTALAKKIYEDPEILECFEHRAWVTVGRKPRPSQLLQGVLAQLDGVTRGESLNINDRYLIVLDDIWETEVLDELLSSLRILQKPVDRCIDVLLTARDRSSIENIVERILKSHPLVVPLLNEEESKELLCHKVFGEETCPPELDNAATEIAKKCEGLPLMIVTVAGFISNSHSREDPNYWDEIAKEKNSVFTDAYNEITAVLFPSYDYLPQFLKMPFLYMGVFHPDYDAPPSKIINMLMAEGWFHNTNKREPFEEYVWECLDELCMDKYLVLFKVKSTLLNVETSHHHKFKTCRLHSSWRHVCRGEAPKNKFYQVLKRLVDGSEEVVKGQRCLCLQNNILFGIKQLYDSVRLNCASSTRSILFYGPYHQYQIPTDFGFRLLRELDALNQRFYCFPEEMLALVQLKYLALTCNGEIPGTISKLLNLQVLIIHPHMRIRCCRAPSYIPIQIWDMQELEHIEILGKSLVAPHCTASLGKLLTLVGANATICTILKLSARIPNIRKLGVQIELMPNEDHSDLLSCFGCISTLGSLETLKCSIINPVIQYGRVARAAPNSLMLPRALKKLHLSGTGLPWEYMDAIGALPSLQVLKLRAYAFRGSEWEVQGDGFQNLEFLLIEDTDLVEWIPRSGSFRMLSYLSMKHCYKFHEIYWPALSMLGRIELVDCNPSVLTRAKQIQPTRRVHLDIIATSSVDKKPVTINFRSYSESEKEALDMASMVGSVEDVDITFSSHVFLISIIILFGWLLKLRIVVVLHYFGFC